MSKPVFHRVLLKLSGEALMGAQKLGVDAEVAGRIGPCRCWPISAALQATSPCAR